MSRIPTEIVDPHDERVSFFKNLKGNAPRIAARGVILVEGEKQLAALFRSGIRIEVLFMEERFYTIFSSQVAALSDVQTYVASRPVMEQIIGYRLHQGIMALATRPAEAASSALALPAVALNGLSDPENVGTILRSAAAFGIHGCIYDHHSSDPLIRRSIRVSMGAAFYLDISYEETLSSALVSLKRKAKIVAIEKAPRAVSVFECKFSADTVFVLGNEQNGIAPEVLDVCDQVVEVPMSNRVVQSLNVANAASIVFAEYFRALSQNP